MPDHVDRRGRHLDGQVERDESEPLDRRRVCSRRAARPTRSVTVSMTRAEDNLGAEATTRRRNPRSASRVDRPLEPTQS
ncbi:hypothetical protein [Actinoallomurus liliacearum]|uniref:hypothetical protein n=1 Tax=Actinoallomurus liliacearum TaxID=1080073 RepID=UPI0031EA2C29